MKKKNYIPAVIKIVCINNDDVVTASPDGTTETYTEMIDE